MVKWSIRGNWALSLMRAMRFIWPEGDLKMNTTLGIKLAAVAAFAALAGCTDLKPLQADIASLKTQVGTLSSDVAALKTARTADDAATAAAATSATAANTAARAAQTSAASAGTAASAASSKADAAQAAANKAAADAAAAQAAVAALDEKVERMFKRSISK